ncbi:MAG: METTL5 family protein [Thermoplasmata archaeon]|jgi:putative methylase
MDRRELEKIISSLKKLDRKKILLEQYETTPELVADIVFIAINDIKDKIVADLGCGNGAFALASYLVGAREVHCVEIDRDAIEVALKNFGGRDIKIHNMNVKDFNTRVDTVIMNPPFGYQIPGADRIFIEKALEISDIIYTIHHKGALPYIRKILDERGEIEFEKDYKLNIPYGYSFHKSESRNIDVKMIKIRVKRYG